MDVRPDTGPGSVGPPLIDVLGSYTVMDSTQRSSSGLDFWVDGTFGVHRRLGTTTVIAPNGPSLARHRLDGSVAEALGAGLEEAAYSIGGIPADVDHASGGPLHFIDEAGLLLLVYHGERFAGGDAQDYRSFLGMAVSYDEGTTFRDLGPIIRTAADVGGVDDIIDVGSGAFTIRDGWFEVYYQDRACGIPRSNLSVARCRESELLSAACAGVAPRLKKWGGTAFDQPGIGGRDTEVLPISTRWTGWFDAFVSEPSGRAVLVCSGRNIAAPANWTVFAISSDDGVAWSDPCELLEIEGQECLYVTVVPDPDSVGEFDLYTVRASTDPRWGDAELVRTRCSVSGTDSTPVQIR